MKPQPTEAEIQFILDAISEYLTVKVHFLLNQTHLDAARRSYADRINPLGMVNLKRGVGAGANSVHRTAAWLKPHAKPLTVARSEWNVLSSCWYHSFADLHAA